MTDRDDLPTPARRRRSPALIGGGLAVAAVIVVIVVVLLRDDGADTGTASPTTAEPTSVSDSTTPATEPSTTPAATTTDLGPGGISLTADRDAGCITVTTAGGSATGCPQPSTGQLDERTFVADLGGPVLITSESSDPFVDPVVTVDDGAFAAPCRWDDLAPRIPDGGLVEVAVCNDTGVMGVPTRSDAGDARSLSYFTLPTPYLPEGTDLGPGTPVDGLPGALAFTAQVQDVARCTILLRPDRSGWSEVCGTGDGDGPAVALVEVDRASPPALHQVTIDPTGLITSAERLGAMAPSSGCSIEDADDLARAVPASSLVVGMGCIGDTASLTTGSVLTQEGPPDGSIWIAARDDGIWTITDNGTGIEDTFAFPVIPTATWSPWPESTVPDVQADWRDPVMAIPARATVELFADDLLATLGSLATDPEFPPNQRLVAVQPDGLPLIVAQVDIGGDDSVAGAVVYVWLGEEFDDTGPTGWRAGEVLVGFVCARGVTPERDLCI